jgi:predicted NBD/HSP70 family sugar kinase
VENDCNLAVLGEQWRGVATGCRNVIVVLAGERLGAGILMDGRLVRGRAGGAGEMSYLYLTEGVNDAHDIAAVARELGERAVAQGWAAPEPGQVTAETVLNAASAGDEVAMDIVDRLGRRFARVAATLDLLLDPDLLVFGGAVAQAGEVFLPAIQRHLPAALEAMDAPPLEHRPRIEASSLGDQVVATGATRRAIDLAAARCLGGAGEPIIPAPEAVDAA